MKKGFRKTLLHILLFFLLLTGGLQSAVTYVNANVQNAPPTSNEEESSEEAETPHHSQQREESRRLGRRMHQLNAVREKRSVQSSQTFRSAPLKGHRLSNGLCAPLLT